jgi:hypothetical protein
MTEKANAKEIPWMASGEVTPSSSNKGPSRLANAGSPIQPRPSEASVIPSWQADR